MELKKFLDFYSKPKTLPMIGGTWSSPGGIVSDFYSPLNTPVAFQVPWWFRYSLAETLKGTNFGCDFKEGLCAAERPDGCVEIKEFKKEHKLDTPVNFCCSCCHLNIGNLELLPNDTKILTEIADLFEPGQLGFWRSGIGCILPYKYRSTMCLVGRCGFIGDNFILSRETKIKIYKLGNIRSEWIKYKKENKHGPI
ncbi:MAG: hypothetical protein KAS32_06880 [Candidatus Peribacteraceae bacterium]|nr:hypothetical protein [Candidatus Peribacteraceae bacterium]